MSNDQTSDSVDTRQVQTFQVVVSMPEPNQVKFVFGEPYKFPSPTQLYSTLRDILTEYFRSTAEDPDERIFLPIKYGSRVYCSNFPMIHDPRDHSVYLDPLQTVRDAVMEVQRTRTLILYKFSSRPYFYRTKTPADQFPPNPPKPVRQARTLSLPREDGGQSD